MEAFMAAQRAELQKAIADDKWFLSEKARKDVGEAVAKSHFLDRYLHDWAARFRQNYCKTMCRLHSECEAAA
jgi:hypothetical protein